MKQRTDRDRCGNCIYGKLIPGDDGPQVLCLRYPPQIVPMIEQSLAGPRQSFVTVIPQVGISAWCGEHEFSNSAHQRTLAAINADTPN